MENQKLGDNYVFQYDANMIILGIDPGTRVTGFGIILYHPHKPKAIDFGSIRTPTKASSSEKYLIIFEEIEQLIQKHNPEVLAVESQFMHKNAMSAMKLGMARAMALLAAERKKIPIFEYTPKKAKKAIVGHGSATKEQVQKMIQALLNLPILPTPDDAADALALALCHAHEVQWRARCLNT